MRTDPSSCLNPMFADATWGLVRIEPIIISACHTLGNPEMLPKHFARIQEAEHRGTYFRYRLALPTQELFLTHSFLPGLSLFWPFGERYLIDSPVEKNATLFFPCSFPG